MTDQILAKIPEKPRRLTSARHQVVFTILKPFLRFFVWIAFNFHAQRFQNERKHQPYLILSNHNGALDPFMLAQSFHQPIYFVASDHIFRLGLASRLIAYLVAPIPIVKSQIDIRAIRQIMTIQKEGGTVCLFPSGNRSFTGPEMPIPPATAKLVKQLKCPVLLYRFEGGYLTSPRWARSHRRGRMTGQVVRELSVAEIATLSSDAINRILVETLNDDPYLEPAGKKIFRGQHLAEYLERILFVCPNCLSLNSLYSREDQLLCSCGFAARYQPDGRFSAANPLSASIIERLPHVKAFDLFQKSHLARLLADPAFFKHHQQEPFFSDDDQDLLRAERASRSVPVMQGRMSLFSDRLEFTNQTEKRSFPLEGIGMFSVHGPQVLQFHDTKNDTVYEVRSNKPRSAYRYMVVDELLRALKCPDPAFQAEPAQVATMKSADRTRGAI